MCAIQSFVEVDVTCNNIAAGNITFAKTLDGAQAVTINTAGDTVFTGKVGFTDALSSLTTDDSGAGKTYVNGGLVKTVGAQTFNDPIVVGSSATEFISTTSGIITFDKTLMGDGVTPRDITIHANSGDIALNGNVGDGAAEIGILSVTASGDTAFNGQVRVAHLETGSSGTTTFNVASVTTTSRSSMVFGNDVVVTVPSFTFDSTDGGALPDGANITFGKSLSSSNVGQRDIIIRAGDLGVVTFLGPVGKDSSAVASPLSSLMVIAAGGIDIGGGYVHTTGAQTYSSPVTLSASSTLLASQINWPSVTATAPNVDLTLMSPGAQSLTDITITGNLNVITGMDTLDGGVSQQAGTALHVDGTSTFTAHTKVGQVANLASEDNYFGGAVSMIPDAVHGGTWSNAVVVSKSPLKVGETKVTGDLSLKATGGEITQAGAIEVGGKTDLVATAGGVTLAGLMNNFVGIVNADTAGGLKLNTNGPLTLGQVKTGGDNEINAAGKIDLGTGIYGGKLKVNSGGFEIMQSGKINFGGDTDFNAGNAKIELFNPFNLWKGSIVYKGGIVMINHPSLMNATNAGTLIVRVETTMPASAVKANTPAASQASAVQEGGKGGDVTVSVTRLAAPGQSGIVTVTVSGEAASGGKGFAFALADHIPAEVPKTAQVAVTQLDGKALPEWLRYDVQTQKVIATSPPPGAFPIQIKASMGGVETVIVITEQPK